ncbi:uncharacterized protein LOC133551511 isoform X2 [Nerophis ophidion]|uniref:uncharacterized protein LOC133551511 isoform X2 n=1 Tax=Nerophis ophidion TaxID=159077 RepID=UPI002AE01BBA|nr:uncharacterized protein LOC133551511 isoform X2 [Nerophis ophidion]
MADARSRSSHSKSNPFVTMNDCDVEGKTDYVSEENASCYGISSLSYCAEEPAGVKNAAAEVPRELIRPKFSSTNPFIKSGRTVAVINTTWLILKVTHVFTNTNQTTLLHHLLILQRHIQIPFPGRTRRVISTALPRHVAPQPPLACARTQQAILHLNTSIMDIYQSRGTVSVKLMGSLCKSEQPRSLGAKPFFALHPPSSESEDDYDPRERVPTLRPGQYDGTTPWKEFLHRFESCAEANYWSEKTMAVQLKFCLVGAAGAIIHRNPRSAQWGYCRLVEEMETAYGPSSQHAAAVAIELRRRTRKRGEALHVLRDDIYEGVSVAYSNRTDAEQDAIGVEVFINALGDVDTVQKLLEQHPQTLAQAFDIARRYETTKRAASYVAGLMHPGARDIPERRPRAALIREGTEEEELEPATAPPSASCKHESPSYSHTQYKGRSYKDTKWDEVRCHNCSGLGHMKRNCPSPRKTARAQVSAMFPQSPKSTILHLKAQCHEMSIHMVVYGLEVCAVLDSGSRKSVFPLHHYDAIHLDVRPPLQSSAVETLIGVGPGDIPVLGEAHIPVLINNRQVSICFLVADIAGDEALLGHPFLTQAQARLDFGNYRIVLFGEEVPYFDSTNKPKAHAVRVARTVVLEAGQEYVVKGNIHVKASIKGELMLSPTKGFVEKHRLLVARILVDVHPHKTMPLRIFNPGSSAVTIRKGAMVGFLQPAKVLQPANAVNYKQPEQAANNPPSVPQHLQDLYAESATELNKEEQLQLAQLLCTYSNVFSTGSSDLGRTTLVQHDIVTLPGVPVKQPPRRMASEKQQDADQQIQQSLEAGLARRSNSSWASPIVMDTLDTLSAAKWFSTLDLAAGYWQVELTPRARKAAAFCTKNGLFEWNVMPFGLYNAPATFQRLMDRVLAGMQWETCLVYLDDVIFLGNNVPQMLQRLGQVFSRLQKAKLKLKPSKCCLFRRQVAYLGHVVSENGVATDPGKVRKVQEWPTPSSLKDVRRFVGLASYYRRFIKNFACIAEPLHALTKKHVQFHWSEECQLAFDDLKSRLITAPILGYPLDKGDMILDTDASDVGIGAVLSQVQQGVERVLAYGSRKLSKTEQNYCTTRRELLAVVDFTSHFRQYLLGRRFTVRTDHSSLRWLTRMKEPEGQLARWLERLGEYNFEIVHRPGQLHGNADSLSRRPCRQSCPCKLQNPSIPQLSVSHQAVQCDLYSDINQAMLSPVGVDKALSADSDNLKPPEKIFLTTTKEKKLFGGWSLEELRQAQEGDADIAPIRTWLTTSEERPAWVTVSPCSPATKTYWSQWKRLYVKDGILVRRFYCLDDTQFYPQVVLPRVFRADIMRQMHDGQVGGLFGVERTVARLQTRYFWYRMREDVALWCNTCTSCASKARPRKTPQAPMGTVRVGAPMERIALDVMGQLNETERKNRYVLVIQDYFTKWVEAIPIPNEQAVTVAEVLASEWVCRYGAPQTLHSDKGRNFESEVFQEMCALFGIDKTHTTPFRPQSDGQVERFNATLQKILATTAERCHWDWDLMIPYAVMAYRATKHSSTGFTPNYMMFGRELSEPVDLVSGLPPDPELAPSGPVFVQDLRERLELAHQITRDALGESVKRAKRQYDKNCYRTHYNIGDAVWYLIKGTRPSRNKVRKFLPSYEGPFFVLGQLHDLVYRIQKGPRTKVKVVHHDQLKPYRCRDPLDNTWVLEQAPKWIPMEVSPPDDIDLADSLLGLPQLFSRAEADDSCSYPTSDPAVGISVASHPSTTQLGSPVPVDLEDSGGGVAVPHPQSPRSQRPRRRRRSPAKFGEWVAH